MFGIDIGSVLTGIPLKGWLYGGLAAILVTVGTVGYVKWHNMQTTIHEQEATLSAYDVKVTQEDALIAQQKTDAKLQKQIRDNLEADLKKSAQALIDYAKRFEGQGNKSFAYKLNFDSVGMTAYLNQDTRDSLRCIEIATGSPLTEAEKNEKDPITANIVCSDIANPGVQP